MHANAAKQHTTEGGIQGYSKTGKAYAIFSVANSIDWGKPNAGHLQKNYDTCVRATFANVASGDLETLEGFYEGEYETSYICTLDDFKSLRADTGLAGSLIRNEKTVLVLGPQMDSRSRMRAYLFDANADFDTSEMQATPTNLGFLGEVTKEFAECQNAYSARNFGNRKVYFVAMQPSHWQAYEALVASGDLERVQHDPDWYTAKPVMLTARERFVIENGEFNDYDTFICGMTGYEG